MNVHEPASASAIETDAPVIDESGHFHVTDAPIDLSLGLLTSFLSAITFLNVLWSVGGDLVLHQHAQGDAPP